MSTSSRFQVKQNKNTLKTNFVGFPDRPQIHMRLENVNKPNFNDYKKLQSLTRSPQAG